MDKYIENLRGLIDRLDSEIIEKVAKRHEISKQIGEYKQQYGLEILDQDRENKLQEYHKDLSIKHNIAQSLVLEIFDLIIKQSKTLQQ
ncbi:MAG: chorismate mutase [Proteobacteria bacterium]|jgi:chorismate mutase|nr:chorismate mutase [Pseudomonadota bacterium]